MGIFSRRGRPFRDELVSLRQIGTLFIKPLLQHKTGPVGDISYLEELWGIDSRAITRWMVEVPLQVPGILVEGSLKIQGVGWRKVYKGDVLLVRHDADYPNIYEISFMGGHGGKEHVYELNETEWNSIEGKIRLLSAELDQS